MTARGPGAADPAGGRITVYESADVATAAEAGARLAAYLGSGPTRVQYALDTASVVRQLGASLVFFAWSPSNAPDPRTVARAAARATVGTEIPVRSL